jgi:hypothetical protein
VESWVGERLERWERTASHVWVRRSRRRAISVGRRVALVSPLERMNDESVWMHEI